MLARVLVPGSLLLAACGGSPSAPEAPPAAPPPSASAPATSAAPSAQPTSTGDASLPPPPALPKLANRRTSTGGCSKTAPAPPAVMSSLDPGLPFAVWEETLADGGCVSFPKDESLDVAAVVFEGAATLEREDAPDKTALGGPWMGVRAPGGGVSMRAASAKARVLFVVATANGTPLSKALPGRTWAARKKPLEVLDFTKRPDLAWGKGAYHARIGWGGDDGPPFVIDTLRFAPTAGVAEHVHDKQWECLVVLDGDGDLVVKKGGGESKTAVSAGVVACIPPNTPHAWVPSGKAPLYAVQVYAPPGPEQRFVKLAGEGK